MQCPFCVEVATSRCPIATVSSTSSFGENSRCGNLRTSSSTLRNFRFSHTAPDKRSSMASSPGMAAHKAASERGSSSDDGYVNYASPDDEYANYASPRDLEDELSSSQQLQALDLQISATPALSVASLRDAILGYLHEAELIVRERLSQNGAAEKEMPAGLDAASRYQDAAVAGENASWSSSIDGHQGDDSSYSGLNLIKRGQALRRRFSTGTRSIIPANFSTSPEALLAHLSSIRADVLASMPTVHLPSLSVPTIPSRPSFTRLASLRDATAEGSLPNMMAGFLSSLPARLSYIHEQLPTPPDLSQMSSVGMTLPQRGALAFTEEHKRRIMQIVHGMLPSEDWAGWEKLGWEDEDEYQARMATSRSNRAHRKSWSNGSPEGKSFLRELDHDALGLHHYFVRKRPPRRRTVSEGVVDGIDFADEEGEEDDDLEEEVQEEPEYLFPNKTPRAALSRHQSYVVTQEAFERERQARRRSASATSSTSRQTNLSEDEEIKAEEEAEPGHAEKPFIRTRRGRPIQPVGPAQAAQTMPPVKAIPNVVLEGLRKSKNGKVLIRYDDLPPWMQNNEYIHTGYR
jgi:adiponectin receptor